MNFIEKSQREIELELSKLGYTFKREIKLGGERFICEYENSFEKKKLQLVFELYSHNAFCKEIYEKEIKEEQKMNTIILCDQDDCRCYAVIRTKEDPSKIEEVIDNVKDSMPGEWSYDDLMLGLIDSGIEYEVYENITYINF